MPVPTKELNTLAPKKWVDDFGGVAPTLDINNGIRVGDFAMDLFGGPNNIKIWRCYDNTVGAPVWEPVIRTPEDFTSGNLAAERLPVSGVWTVGDGATLEITGTMASRIKVSCPITMGNDINTGVIIGVNEINGEKLLWGYSNIAMNQMPTGGTWNLSSALTIDGGDLILNRRIQCFTYYSNQFEMRNTSATGIGTFLIENNIGIARALKILNAGSSYAGTSFLNDFNGTAITEPNATCIANRYNASMYIGTKDRAIACFDNGRLGLGIFNASLKPGYLLDIQPLRDATDNTILRIGDTRAGNTSDAFRFIAQNDGGRLLIYNLGTAKIDLRAGGNSDISPAGYLTVNPANDLRVSSNTIFNYDYADRDFTIRKLTSGVAYNYDAGLDQHTWYAADYFLRFTGGSGVFGISHNNTIQYAQFGNQGFGIVDGVNNLTAAYGVQNIRYINSTSDYWFGLYYQEFIFNSIYSDVDFVINKYNSGIAYKYDSGDDIHKWGNADLLTGAPSAKYLFTEGNLTVQNETTGNTYLRVQNLWSGTRYSGGMSINGIEFRIGLGDYPRTIDIYGTTQNHLMFTSGRTIFNNSNLDQDFIIKKLTSGNALVYDAGLDTLTIGSQMLVIGAITTYGQWTGNPVNNLVASIVNSPSIQGLTADSTATPIGMAGNITNIKTNSNLTTNRTVQGIAGWYDKPDFSIALGTGGALNLNNYYGGYIANIGTLATGVTIQNQYGLYIERPTTGSTINRALHTNGGAIRFNKNDGSSIAFDYNATTDELTLNGTAIYLQGPADGTRLNNDPTGTVDLAVATVGYVKTENKKVGAITTVTTATYNCTATDDLILANAASNNIEINLLTPSSTYDRKTFTIKKIDSTANTVTIKSSSGNIDGTVGTTGVVINTQYESITVVCDATSGNYWII